MESIQPVSGGNGGYAGQIQPSGGAAAPAAQRGGAVGGQQAAGQVGSSMTLTSTTTNMSMVYSKVDSMMSNVGLNMADNQVLRMIIALMIMEALLAQDGGSQQAGGVGLFAGGSQQSEAMFLSIQSETNTIQIQEQSSTLATSQGIQALGLPGGQTEPGGSQLDMQA